MKKLLKWLGNARTEVTVVLGSLPLALQALVLVGVIPSTTAVKAGQLAGTLLALLTGSPLASNNGPAGSRSVSPPKG